ncbi:MAG: hypothetical protein IPM83_15200 [Ignavibacteria bacterium]|nr:hypothetical protein [Ignavibacteria bacterium]
MDIHITTRHCTLTDTEHQAAVDAATHFEKFHNSIIRVDAIVDEGPSPKPANSPSRSMVNSSLPKNPPQTSGKAIHDAAQKIQRQLTKIHDKQTSH